MNRRTEVYLILREEDTEGLTPAEIRKRFPELDAADAAAIFILLDPEAAEAVLGEENYEYTTK